MFTHREHVLKRATTYIILFYTKFSFKRAIFKRNLDIHKKQIAPFFKKNYRGAYATELSLHKNRSMAATCAS